MVDTRVLAATISPAETVLTSPVNPELTDPKAIEAAKNVPSASKKRAWGVTPQVFENDAVKSFAPVVFQLIVTAAFNKSEMGRRFYMWLNENYTPFEINCYWTFGITSIVYWIGGLLFMLVDMTERPSWIYRYKIQPYKKITWSEYAHICTIVLRNQVFVALPLSAFIAGPLKYIRGMASTRYEDLPGFWGTLGTYVFCLLCEEAGFYYIHRMMHRPSLYAKFHKQHHIYTAPVALSSTYCTIVEHLFGNLCPIVLGLVILGSHWSMVNYFFCGLELGTLCTHSGYNVPYLFNSLIHDWHHFSFEENFGPTGLLDAFHGSDTRFQEALKKAVVENNGDREAAMLQMQENLARATYEEELEEVKKTE